MRPNLHTTGVPLILLVIDSDAPDVALQPHQTAKDCRFEELTKPKIVARVSTCL